MGDSSMRAVTVLLGALLVAMIAAPSAAAGETADVGAAAGWSRPLVTEALGTLSEELTGLAVEGSSYRQAYDAWDTAGRELASAAAALGAAEAVVADLTTLRGRLADQLLVLHGRRLAAQEAEAAARAALVEVAVGDFMGGAEAASALARLAAGGDASEPLRAKVLLAAAGEATEAALARAEAALSGAVDAERQTAEALADTERRHAEAVEERAAAAARSERWQVRRQASTAALATGARDAVLAGTDLRVLALDAYWKAASGHGARCGLTWPVLAGIGRVETRHGTYGGRTPDPEGDVVPRIVGIPLDGTNGTASIGDTDGGALDGDPTVDRAVGPMQFIPSTWRAWGGDGNGDGVADPNNLYDATAAAARYLCATGRGDVRRAVLSYNRSEAYVAAVLGHADGYAAGVDIPLAA